MSALRTTAGKFGWLLVLALVLGCESGPKLPPMARVSGTVTLDGKPVTRGLVQFQPDKTKGTDGPVAIGMIGADGKFDLVTAQVKGAMVGHHTVMVEARAEPKNEMDTYPALLVPEKYVRHETSGLAKEVVAGQANVIDLELKSK
ncbi:MAG TPA: hypothetical protein VL096_06535 [Pirellulaceae bacterium]|nr:hypothetical protein [Pirellulaceae bacterium]